MKLLFMEQINSEIKSTLLLTEAFFIGLILKKIIFLCKFIIGGGAGKNKRSKTL